MKLQELKKLHPEDYYWRMVFGKSIHRTSFFQLRATNFEGLPDPVFFLSTGRCGTNWFTDLLSHDKRLKAFHEPKPNLGIQGRIAYTIYRESALNPPKETAMLLQEIFLTGREQYLRYSYKTQRRFVETNNQMTFLAPAIYALFPKTKFVHLNRHPGEFVRSALRRNFYNNIDDIKRIVPGEANPVSKDWKTFTQLQKNSWLWNETNQFIEDFKKEIPADKSFYFDFSALSEEKVQEMNQFLGVSIENSVIRKAIGKPKNVQKSGQLSGFESWKDEDKAALKQICSALATKYNYHL